MKRSEKLVRIHALLILLFSIICITGATLLCFDKCVVSYVCLLICIIILPCLGALNFEYRLSLREEAFQKEQNNESDENDCDQQYPSDYINDR